MNTHILKSLLLSVFCVFCALNVYAASSLFSNYGQIQNVQSYSSNPFWTPNSPYSSAIPRPVYAQGPDLSTEECVNVVKSLVSVQCMVRDNCKNTPLSDIRPEIMVQLSKLPNHNYVSACGGFIDGIYEEYVEYYGNNAPTRVTAFPSATTPNKNATGNNVQIENPYKTQPAKWQQEIQERAQELEELQRQNGGNSAELTATEFPATYADLSLSERVANEMAGLEPYKDMKAYRELNVQTLDEWCAEHSDAPGCSKVTKKKTKKDNGKDDDDDDNKDNKDDDTSPVPNGLLIAARIHKQHKFVWWGDGKTGTTGRGCFAICDVDQLTDDLNGKAFYPILGKRFCADKNQDGLVIDAETKKPLQMTKSEFNDVKQKIVSSVADKGNCDYHPRNYLFQVGYFYPDTYDFVQTDEIYLDD